MWSGTTWGQRDRPSSRGMTGANPTTHSRRLPRREKPTRPAIHRLPSDPSLPRDAPGVGSDDQTRFLLTAELTAGPRTDRHEGRNTSMYRAGATGLEPATSGVTG